MKPGNKALLIDIIIILVISFWLYFITVLFSSESSEVKRETDDLIEKQLQLDFDQIDGDFDDSDELMCFIYPSQTQGIRFLLGDYDDPDDQWDEMKAPIEWIFVFNWEYFNKLKC